MGDSQCVGSLQVIGV